MKTIILCSVFVTALASTAQASCDDPASFPAWLEDVRTEAQGMGISANAISVLDGMTYDPAVIKRDRAQSVILADLSRFPGAADLPLTA